MNGRVLIADDEQLIRTLVRDFLEKAGYTVTEAGNGMEALEAFGNGNDFSIVILDIMMPLLDGYEVLKRIRGISRVPVILLTAKSEEQDEIDGLGLGADEYVTKPFSPRTLVARVDALIRRSSQYAPAETAEAGTGAPLSGDVCQAGGIILDKAAHTVLCDGEAVELSFKEFELLAYFMENSGIALSREKILNSVWNYDYFGDSRTVDTHVKKLRAKLKDKGDLIQTIWGIGYKFAP